MKGESEQETPRPSSVPPSQVEGTGRDSRSLTPSQLDPIGFRNVKSPIITNQASMDPNQTYILSGPYVRYDHFTRNYVSVFTAKPVPAGMTVIATPLRPSGPAANGSMMKWRSQFNPNAAPFIPRPASSESSEGLHIDQESRDKNKDISSRENSTSSPNSLNNRLPCFMYWSSECPEGKLMPLRQPQPPVYFQGSPNR